MNKVFIFSTRYSYLFFPEDDNYKKGTGMYLFSEDNCDEEQYFFDTNFVHKPADQEIVKWILQSTQREKYKTAFLNKLEGSNEVKEEIWKVKIEKKTEPLGSEEEKHLIELAKFDYYSDSVNQKPQKYCKIRDKNIYAVIPYDKHDERKEWIECLLNLNKFVKSADEVFLLLHDEDIYSNGEPFKVLEETEVRSITKVNKKVNILVFQHISNDVTAILRKPYTEKETADNIENIFYKKPYFDKISNYHDSLFEGKNLEKPECPKKLENKLNKIETNVVNCNVVNILKLLEKDLDGTDNNVYHIKKGNRNQVRVRILKQCDYRSNFPLEERKGANVFYQEFYQDLEENRKQKELTPTIYISLFDFLDDENEYLKILTPYLPRYKNIIDSSIWNYYVPYYKEKPNFDDITENKEDFDKIFEKRLSEVVDEINANYENRLYVLPKTREYVNLMYRLLKESYLKDIGGHAALVSPFLFTSESKMKEAADNVLKKIEKIDKKLSWRFLLVDDESYLSDKEIKESELTENEKRNTDKTDIARKKSKCQIIKNIFCNNFNFECECGKNNPNCKLVHKNLEQKNLKNLSIKMVCVKSNDAALEKLLSAEKYDIVLIDYLLGTNKNNEREYSTEMLKKIEKEFKGKDKIIQGIYGKFWFFYISAYDVAVHERLLEKQFLHITEYWHIEEGACPINTPQLFRYLLFSYMKRQIDVITRPQEKIKDKNEQPIKLISVIDLLNHIFRDISEVRNRAIENFNNLLKLRLTYDKIKYDTYWKYIEKGEENIRVRREKDNREKSELIPSLFPDISHYDNAFWEHIMHLSYLIAFGTIRQWHDMWEEFMLIKPYLQKAYDERDGKKMSLNPKAKDVIKYIETYITSLQNQSQ